MSKVHRDFYSYYENIEINFSTGQTSVPLSQIVDAANTFRTKFSDTDIAKARYPRLPTRIELRTNNTISFSLLPGLATANPQTAVNDFITVTSSDSPFVIDGVEFGDVLLTNNSGSTAALKILIRDSQY